MEADGQGERQVPGTPGATKYLHITSIRRIEAGEETLYM